MTDNSPADPEALARQLADLVQQLQERDQRYQELAGRHATLEADIGRVLTARDAHASGAAALRQKLEGREQRYRKVMERYRALALRAADLAQRLQERNQQYQELSGRHEPLVKELSKVRVNRDAHASEVVALGQKLESREQRYRKVLERQHALGLQLEHLQRSLLSEEPLRHMLPGRRAAAVPPSERQAANQREMAFAARSTAYRNWTERGDFTAVPMEAVAIDGLTWWFPIVPGDRPNRAETLTRRGLNLEDILETRELGIGGVMIDIGANIGRTAIPRALLGDAQIIYAAEPEPANYACLVRNVFENNLRGVVLPDQVAIGSRDGSVRLERGRASTGHHVIYNQSPDQPRRRIDVPCYTMDTWLDQLGVDLQAVRFVKLDTNGYEIDVLRGATRLLALRSAVWKIEVAPECLQGFGVELTTLTEELAKHFTHFVDLNKNATGPRVRPVAEMNAALEYLPNIPRTGKAPVTDLLLYAATQGS